jgi:hypothetical protein
LWGGQDARPTRVSWIFFYLEVPYLKIAVSSKFRLLDASVILFYICLMTQVFRDYFDEQLKKMEDFKIKNGFRSLLV